MLGAGAGSRSVRVVPEAALDEFADLDATAVAQLIRSGEVSTVQVVEASIERLESLNPTLNAVIHPSLDRAREAAKREVPDAPFAGVPFLVKDLIAHAAGEPFHEGIAGIKASGFCENRDTELVRRFRSAGLITLGRTNTSELGLVPTTEPVAYGPTRNPWSLDRSPLGSGGGSAAAVAAGIVPMAHSNDGGGSIRLPASACGLIGLKPTRGTVSLAPDFGDVISGTVCEFAITRSARDAIALFDVVAGRSVGEPYGPPRSRSAPSPRLRIGLMVETPARQHTVDPVCRQAAERTAVMLEQLGHVVEERHPVALDDTSFLGDANKIMPFAFAAFAAAWWKRRTGIELTPEDVEPWTWTCIEFGRKLSAADYLSAVEHVQRWTRDLAAWWEDGFDLLVTPTVPEPPPMLGTFDSDDNNPFRVGSRSGEIVAFTYPFNVSGQPAISLPTNIHDGLPIGTQLVAGHGNDRALLDTALALDEAGHLTTAIHPPPL